ncbi:Nuclear factor related to kappa-B-binding protein [Trema orientale]|uniref:Nuclear factor related to kappa-B-binding protein n=1 Tax=Trema orientale TaxID=63057 RepID=A0A2P5BNW0_TREOI|nr:Nuclear factor related to kappa-B-binding protein [Trema orientale]
MAADQWRKRLNSTSIVGCYGREQHKAKRRNTGLPQYDSNLKSHISLEWDGNQKRVVARREQIGINWRDLKPFIGSAHAHNITADVCAVPQDIFELENLKEVLSYEVWETCLSESERNHLMQFLPRGPEAEQVLQALLAGDNFHFGSPFLNWQAIKPFVAWRNIYFWTNKGEIQPQGASLCSGHLHPDAILQQDQCLKTEKKSYYAEVHKYHNNMIGYLLKLKERFENCQDPEKEIVQKMWRSKNDMDKRISSSANDSRVRVLEDNVEASSESCSWVADEKACSSDNQNSSVIKGGDLKKRVHEKGSLKDNGGIPLIVSDDALDVGVKFRKGDKHHQQNVHSNDGAKYMSYFKISKKQHEIVKNMKQSGKSIQSRSLNRVLGNINSFNVQPYEVFIEEEQKKLREHWIKLANKALPAAFANWRGLHSQRQQIRMSLEQEMKERLKMLAQDDEVGESHETPLQDQIEIGVEDPIHTLEHDDKSVSGSPEKQSQEQFSSGGDLNSTDSDSGEQTISKLDHATFNPTEYSENANTADVVISQGVQLSGSGDVWPAGNISHSYYDSTASHECTSDDGLSFVHPKMNDEQQTHVIDLESDVGVGDTGKDMVRRQSEDTSFRQSDDGSLGSYSNQDRNELFQSLFKGQVVLPYHQEQKQTGLDFQSPNSMLVQDGQFAGHFQGQSHPSLPVEQGQKRENDIYVQKNTPDSIYSDGGSFLIPRQESLAPVHVQDWAVNSVRMPPPIQTHLNGGELQNWFPGEHQVRGGWTGSGGASVPSQSMGGGNGGDQSLFSVLSQCNQLRSSSAYHSMASSEQFIPPRNYGLMGRATPGISNALPQSNHSLDYMSGREAASSLMPDDMGWMSLPHQNSGLQDPMGKPYLRSWNQ